jgi:group I intron endonuclease
MRFDQPVIYGTSYKGKLYIGQHTGNNKNYIGSGKIINYIKKNPNKCKYLITGVIEYVNREQLDSKEKYWISKLKPELNLHEGGRNNITDSTLRKMSESRLGPKNGMYGKTHSDELKKRYSVERKGIGNPFYGKKHKKDFINNLSNTIHKKVKCLHCNTIQNLGNYSKWHGDKCKKRITNDD